MGRRFSRRLSGKARAAGLSAAMIVSVAALTGAGCDPDPLFGSCEFSASIVETCEEEAETTVYNCVVAPLPANEQRSSTNGHPSCLEKVCASWQGSDPFCTRECEQDADCPAASTCQEHLEVKFCVPDAVVGSVEPGPTGGTGGGGGEPDAGGGDAGGGDTGGGGADTTEGG